MRSLDIIRQKRRFMMFNEKTRDKVLELNSFFGKYQMHYEETIKKTFTYYDTPNHDLQKSNIVLFKTQIGNFCELNMATEKLSSTHRYNMRTNYKHFTKQIKSHDSILKHKDFLIDNFTNMFLSSINFDPEFLMRKLEVAYVIDTKAVEYRSLNVTGLKITYSFDNDIFTNNKNKRKSISNILTIYQHSGPKTDEDFEDLISKLSRYCKELESTSSTKIQIARELTRDVPNTLPTTKQNQKVNPKDKKKANKN